MRFRLFERRPPRVKPRRSTRKDADETSLDPASQELATDSAAGIDTDDLPPLEPPKEYFEEAEPAPSTADESDEDSEQSLPSGERTQNRGQLSLSRFESTMSVAERRRLRRLQKASQEGDLPPVVVPRNAPIRIYVSTRWFSALITAILVLVLILFLTNQAFFIREISVGGSRYLSPPEIFQRSGLANMHIFWVDPAEVEAHLKLDPTIADAQVIVGWPPSMVQIVITEREPALIWEQAGQRVWVDVRGRIMQMREDLPNLVRVVVERPSKTPSRTTCPLQGMDDVLGPGSCIDPDTVAGALQFKALYPNVTEIVYDPVKGLGYHDGRNWMLWFGNGNDIETKMAVYDRITEEFYVKKNVQFVEIDVSNPDLPVFSFVPGRNEP